MWQLTLLHMCLCVAERFAHGSGILAVEPEPSEVFLPPVNDSIRRVSMHVVCVPSDPAVEHRCGRAYCAGCCGCFVSMGAWRPQMNERIKQSRAQTCAASRLEVCGLLWPLVGLCIDVATVFLTFAWISDGAMSKTCRDICLEI